jgi:hypothetical protein
MFKIIVNFCFTAIGLLAAVREDSLGFVFGNYPWLTLSLVNKMIKNLSQCPPKLLSLFSKHVGLLVADGKIVWAASFRTVLG